MGRNQLSSLKKSGKIIKPYTMIVEPLLFTLPDQQRPGLTCNTCKHRERHECNSKVFQYCGVRKSNRTDNGLLKIKCKTAACPLHEKVS